MTCKDFLIVGAAHILTLGNPQGVLAGAEAEYRGDCGGLMAEVEGDGSPIGVIKLTDYELKLPTKVTRLPLLLVRDEGEFSSLTGRTQRVRERLGFAFALVAAGGTLMVADLDTNPRLIVRTDMGCDYSVFLVRPADVMPQQRAGAPSRAATASYIAAVIDAYVKLFREMQDPADLPIVYATVDGAILLGIYLQAKEVAENQGRTRITPADLQMAINIMSDAQRLRLHNLAYFVPRRWVRRAH